MSSYDLVILLISVATLAVLLLVLRKVRNAHLRLLRLPSQLSRAVDVLFRQFEAMLALNRLLDLEKPLPPTRGFAASPDFLLVVAKHSLRVRPVTVVECGSGVSTIVLARCMQLNGVGHVFSLEHDRQFGDKTREELSRQSLSEWGTVLDAPLQPTHLRGEDWPWYARNGLPNAPIDLLIVDGPPMATRPLARYPAGPILFPKLAGGSVVFLDDADRADEKQVLRLWVEETPGVIVTQLTAEKGLVRVQIPTK